MALWVIGSYVARWNNRGQLEAATGINFGIGSSESNIRKLAWEQSLVDNPPEDGWEGRSINICLVPHDIITKVYEMGDKEPDVSVEE